MNTTLYKTAAGEQTVMALYDSALQHWSVPYETRCISTRHGETFVIAGGNPDAPALILLHGAGSNSTIWAGDAIDYSRLFRVYAVDLVGEAGKSAPNRPAWEGDAFAEWLSDVFDGLEIAQSVIVGISQGAWTALKFAVAQPDRVAKLVLMTPGGIVPDKRSFLIRALGSMLLGTRGVRHLVRGLFGNQSVPEGVEDIVLQITQVYKPRMGVLPLFSDEELRRLTMPVFLIGGTHDILRDMDQIAARLRPLLPHLSVTIIPGAGHALINTSGCVMAFLTR